MRHRSAALAAALATAALLLAPAPAAASEPGHESRSAALANEARASAGLAPLIADPELSAAARRHAEAMRAAQRLHHSQARASGDRWWRFAENVGAGWDVDGVNSAFLDSPSHRAALLGDFDRIGAGVAVESGRVWVVLQFGELRHLEPSTTTGAALGAGVAFVDVARARWELFGPTPSALTYGNPGDHPIAGDWDCDGVDTPGLYRRSDGFVYLRNSNTTGVADIRFYFGDPGDLPVAGDFDGDGCDTVALYRPASGRFFVIDRLGASQRGLGAAERSLVLGDPYGAPLAADFDGDGIDELAVHDRSSGRVTIESAAGSPAVRTFGDPGDVLVAGDWGGDGRAALAALRPDRGAIHFEGIPSATLVVGTGRHLVPVAGRFGP